MLRFPQLRKYTTTSLNSILVHQDNLTLLETEIDNSITQRKSELLIMNWKKLKFLIYQIPQ